MDIVLICGDRHANIFRQIRVDNQVVVARMRLVDARGDDAFLVDGKKFAIGDKLSFQDMAGRELAFIAQKMLSLKKAAVV